MSQWVVPILTWVHWSTAAVTHDYSYLCGMNVQSRYRLHWFSATNFVHSARLFLEYFHFEKTNLPISKQPTGCGTFKFQPLWSIEILFKVKTKWLTFLQTTFYMYFLEQKCGIWFNFCWSLFQRFHLGDMNESTLVQVMAWWWMVLRSHCTFAS